MNKLKEQFDILKTEYVKLLNDMDVLINWGKPQLEALYCTRMGICKLELLELQLQVKAIKRKLELVRVYLAKNQKPDFAEIELIIAAELAQAQLQIMTEAEKIAVSKNLLSNLDSPQRSAELRSLFRSLAKELHPDVNPDLSEEQKNIWNLALDAYKIGDLDKLKALSLIYEKEIKGSESELTFEQITLAIESIKEGCKVLQEEIARIKSVFPFTIEKEIKSEIWVENETQKIKTDIETLKQYEKELVEEYNTLLEKNV
ncbi:MAG: hypothetical protein ABI763_08000 [Bacteroidota bacterium]